MAKTSRNLTVAELRKARASILRQLRVPDNAVRASYVRQFLTCGKPNCRCRRGFKHGPFHYLVQCGRNGAVTKFLLKSPEQRRVARAAIATHAAFQAQLEELSQINTELLRRSGPFPS